MTARIVEVVSNFEKVDSSKVRAVSAAAWHTHSRGCSHGCAGALYLYRACLYFFSLFCSLFLFIFFPRSRMSSLAFSSCPGGARHQVRGSQPGLARHRGGMCTPLGLGLGCGSYCEAPRAALRQEKGFSCVEEGVAGPIPTFFLSPDPASPFSCQTRIIHFWALTLPPT